MKFVCFGKSLRVPIFIGTGFVPVKSDIMRTVTTVIRIDISESPHSDTFWKRSFEAWAERVSCPVTVETTISTSSHIEADDVVLPLVKRKGITNYGLDDVKEG